MYLRQNVEYTDNLAELRSNLQLQENF